jgi:glycosyltransferase involved in cell wall biosynthesis
MMRIGIDFRSSTGQRAGIGTYFHHLVENLAKIDAEDRYILYIRTPRRNLVVPNDRFTVKAFNGPLIFWHMRVIFDVLFSKCDLFVTPSFIPATILPKDSCVLFIADATGHIFPQYHTLKVRILTRLHRMAARRAKKILTISQASKNDIVTHFHVAADKIAVTYLAASEDFKQILEQPRLDSVRRRYRLPERYILFVGSIEPRKNLVGLINAFAKVRTKIDRKLVIAGGGGWLNSDIYETIKDLNLTDSVVFTGYVPQDDLAAIYNLADVFVFPSFYEGFGIPPLEAMSCGVPVIVSHAASLPEVVGDAALTVDPYDTGALAEAIYRIIHDRTLRDELIRKGFSRVKQFSWRLTAEETLGAFSKADRKVG